MVSAAPLCRRPSKCLASTGGCALEVCQFSLTSVGTDTSPTHTHLPSTRQPTRDSGALMPRCENEAVIILAATPIGNLGDASRRLIEALSNAEVIAAEDTRTAIHLMRALGVENRPRLIALHEHNEV